MPAFGAHPDLIQADPQDLRLVLIPQLVLLDGATLLEESDGFLLDLTQDLR